MAAFLCEAVTASCTQPWEGGLLDQGIAAQRHKSSNTAPKDRAKGPCPQDELEKKAECHLCHLGWDRTSGETHTLLGACLRVAMNMLEC